MRIVIALGGNALLQRGEKPDARPQIANVDAAVAALAPLAESHEIVLTHGNGPQVGVLALQSANDTALSEPYPFDTLGAMTQAGWYAGLGLCVLVFFAIGVAQVLGDDSFDLFYFGFGEHTSRIGRGLAEGFHARGAKVVVAGRRADLLAEVVAANPGMASMVLDITDAASLPRFAAELVAAHPDLEVVVNNAGIMRAETITDPAHLADAEATVVQHF